MRADRRQFNLGLTAALAGLGLSRPLQAQKPGAVADANRHYFFNNPTFEMIFLTSLGRAYYSGGDVGKVLYLTKQVEDGNFESAYLAFKQAGDEARQLAEDSLVHGHKESARQAYLWARNFYDSATYFIDGSESPSRFLSTWELLYDCWLKAIPLFDPAIEPIKIPYEGTERHGVFLRGNGKAKKRPLLILANGSDGSLLDMWLWEEPEHWLADTTALPLMVRDRGTRYGNRSSTSVPIGRRSPLRW
jgi:hypothetical protein